MLGRAGGQNRVPTARTLVPLFGYLRSCGIVPPPTGVVPAPLEDLLSRYRRYLLEGRGLAPSTVVSYEATARVFLSERTLMGGGETGVEGLCGAGVTGFLLRECSRLTVGSARNRVNHLRSLLRFLQLGGVIAGDLASAVPPVAGWRDTSLPEFSISSTSTTSRKSTISSGTRLEIRCWSRSRAASALPPGFPMP